MNQPLLFGVMADCQYADAEPTGGPVIAAEDHIYDNQFRQTPAKLRQAVDTFNQSDLAFVVHLGDFVDRDLDDADTLLAITRDLKAPLWHVLGNHDFMGSEGQESRVLQKYGLERGYYSQSIGGYRFIVLDTNDLGVIKYTQESEEWQEGRTAVDSAKASGSLQAYDWNGGLGGVQLAWLDEQLAHADEAGEQAVLFAHHQVFPPSVLNAINDTEIMRVIDSHHCVKVFINGHNHIGAFGERHGVPYVTLPGMVQGSSNAYGVVKLSDTTITVNGCGTRVVDMTLQRAA